MKNTITPLLVLLILFSLPSLVTGTQQDSHYSTETIQLTITRFNYLEEVQDFMPASFILFIYPDYNETSSINRYDEKEIPSRYNSTTITLIFAPSQETQREFHIKFEILKKETDQFYPCDLNEKPGINHAIITFDRYTGHWSGDDSLHDSSGYGRFNGCDDESYYDNENDVELCFSLSIIDEDGDGIPQWYEEHIYHTNPAIDNTADDEDQDDIPLYWEYHWGYDPFIFEDHHILDPDQDGLSNYEEYLVSTWGSDPFCDDMFMELDQMEIGPNGEGAFVPNQSLIQVEQTYAKRNIKFHVDDGCMGGGEIIPYSPLLLMGQGRQYYQHYFLNNDADNWRRGVFRYALFVYEHLPIRGMEFPGEHTILLYFIPGLNSFVISTSMYELMNKAPEESCQHVILHELGHTCGMCMGRPLGCDNQLMRIPFSFQTILFKNYKSVMNYKYAYTLLDYSDGTHGFGDYDDWGNLDLSYFQPKGAL